MTTRRSFLGSILAAATPPGFVRDGVLMPVAPILLVSEARAIAWSAEYNPASWDAPTEPYPPAGSFERQAIDQFSDWAARRNASILEQYLTGSYKPSFR